MNPFGEKGSLHLINSLPYTVLTLFSFISSRIFCFSLIQRLTTLRLRGNDITELGAKQLAIVLKTNLVMISINQIH